LISESKFPRTDVGGLSLSRMIVGTNWFFGYSHCSLAKDELIRQVAGSRDAMAAILEVFFRAGINTVMGFATETLVEAVKLAEDRTGVQGIIVATPHFPIKPETPAKGFDIGEVERVLEEQVANRVAVCMPHQSTTDCLVDRCSHQIRRMDEICRMIRSYGMIPGLSTPMPESIIYADETGLDVESYISIYNSMGFLMQIEVDWISRIIHNAAKPVMTIKPMAAGQLRPFQALNFVWNTIRPRDMVAVGTMSPDEAKELIDLSLSILERRDAEVELQETRSKATLKSR